MSCELLPACSKSKCLESLACTILLCIKTVDGALSPGSKHSGRRQGSMTAAVGTKDESCKLTLTGEAPWHRTVPSERHGCDILVCHSKTKTAETSDAYQFDGRLCKEHAEGVMLLHAMEAVGGGKSCTAETQEMFRAHVPC